MSPSPSSITSVIRSLTPTQLCLTSFYTPTTFTFPKLTITPKTLIAGRIAATSPTDGTLTLPNSGPAYVSFQGANFVPDAAITTITYGPIDDKTRYPCKISPLSTVSLFICETFNGGQGRDMYFTVAAGGDIVTGNDTLSYPQAPTITGVTGCTGTRPNALGTFDCPTEGNTFITITGTQFFGDIAVFIGGKSVLVQDIIGTTKVIVELNEGVGQGVAVAISANQQFSPSVNWISYGEPVISSISSDGCISINELTVRECNRQGNEILTIQGNNFGRDEAKILVANVLCGNVTHDTITPHSKVTCTLPPGRGLDRVVLLFQKNGLITQSSSASISYAQCKSGTYNSPNLDDPECALCPLGQYTNLQGAEACDLCPPGYFSASNGTSICSPCSPGTIAPLPGSLTCVDCQAGTAQSQLGKVKCDECGPGRFSGISGRDSCELCPVGTYSDRKFATSCTSCPAGRFSYQAGSTECQPCSAGSYFPYINITAHNTTNTHNNNNNNERPSSSSSGRNESSNTNNAGLLPGTNITIAGCLACPEGTISSEPGSFQCKPCGKGTYAVPAKTECAVCPTGYVAPLAGLSFCQACPVLSVPNDAGTSCLCAIGTYQFVEYARDAADDVIIPTPTSPPTISPTETPTATGTVGPTPTDVPTNVPTTDTSTPTPTSIPIPTSFPTINNTNTDTNPLSNITSNSTKSTGTNVRITPTTSVPITPTKKVASISCRTCPFGVDCTQAGRTFDDMAVRPGFWRSNNQSLIIYECLYPGHCRGGVNSECGTQRTGPLCALCNFGHRAPTLSSDCSACPARDSAVAVTTIVTLIILAALIVLYYIIIRADRTRIKDQSTRKQFQDLWDRQLWEHPRQYPPRLSPGVLYRHNPTHAIKIIIGFLQIITCISINFSIPWPTAYRSVTAAFSFINIDFVPWQQLGCTVTISYYTKLVIITLIPFGIIFMLACIFLVPSLIRDRIDMSDDSRDRESRRMDRRRFVKLSLFTVFLMYPSISSIVLAMLDCKSVENVSYITVDFTLQCYDNEWNRFLGYNIIMILLYPIGVPVTTAAVLYRFRHRLQEDTTNVALGFLYSGYTASEYYWEVVDLIHKLILTSIIQFFAPRLQLGAGMVVVVTYAIFLLLRRPYAKDEDDRLQLCVLAILYLLLLGGRILQVNSPSGLDPAADVALSILFVVLFLAALCAFIVRIVQIVRSMMRRRQRKTIEKMSKQMETGDDPDLLKYSEHFHDSNSITVNAHTMRQQQENRYKPVTPKHVPITTPHHSRFPTATLDGSPQHSTAREDSSGHEASTSYPSSHSRPASSHQRQHSRHLSGPGLNGSTTSQRSLVQLGGGRSPAARPHLPSRVDESGEHEHEIPVATSPTEWIASPLAQQVMTGPGWQPHPPPPPPSHHSHPYAPSAPSL